MSENNLREKLEEKEEELDVAKSDAKFYKVFYETWMRDDKKCEAYEEMIRIEKAITNMYYHEREMKERECVKLQTRVIGLNYELERKSKENEELKEKVLRMEEELKKLK